MLFMMTNNDSLNLNYGTLPTMPVAVCDCGADLYKLLDNAYHLLRSSSQHHTATTIARKRGRQYGYSENSFDYRSKLFYISIN